jgi:hypothetical protein
MSEENEAPMTLASLSEGNRLLLRDNFFVDMPVSGPSPVTYAVSNMGWDNQSNGNP